MPLRTQRVIRNNSSQLRWSSTVMACCRSAPNVTRYPQNNYYVCRVEDDHAFDPPALAFESSRVAVASALCMQHQNFKLISNLCTYPFLVLRPPACSHDLHMSCFARRPLGFSRPQHANSWPQHQQSEARKRAYIGNVLGPRFLHRTSST